MVKNTPFLKYFIAFVAGIILAYHIQLPDLTVIFGLLFLLFFIFAVLLTFTKPKLNNTSRPAWLGFIGISFLIVAGYLSYSNALPSHQKNHVSHLENLDGIMGVVVQSPTIHATFTSIIIDCKRAHKSRAWEPTTGKVLVRMYDYMPNSLHCGDQLLLAGTVEPIVSKKTIGAFDSKSFYALQKLYQQMSVGQSQIIKYGVDNSYFLKRISEQCAKYCENIIDKSITSKNEANISKALLLGVRSEVDKDLKRAYSNAGVIHVLAVSGLHVTILFAIFQIFFRRWMVRSRVGEIVSVCLLLLLLWAFAFITGLTPSVVRAVVMFSLFLLAQLLGRRGDMTNTVFVSAFIMLLCNAHYLFDVGFQLSYLAVLGIIWIHPWWFEKIEFKNKIYTKICEAASITVAAQLSTAPLCIYYFHQFPTYFLPANLLVIFLTNGVMILLIALLACSWIIWLPTLIAWLAQWLLLLSNKWVTMIDGLPLATVDSLSLDSIQLCCIYLLFAGLILVISSKKFYYSYLCLLAALAFVSAALYSEWKISKRNEIIIIAGDPMHIGIINGNCIYMPYISTPLPQASKVKLALYGIKYFEYGNRNQPSIAQYLHGFSMVALTKGTYINKVQNHYRSLGIDACYSNAINGGVYIYWLRNIPEFPYSNLSKNSSVPYLKLAANDMIASPIHTLN